MNNKILIVCVLSLFVGILNAQDAGKDIYQPTLAIKTNALYLATATPNLGIEIGLSKKFTLDISGNYDPIKLSKDKYLKHWMVQPEVRYWFCERFNGHFVGVHGHYAQFDEDGLTYFNMQGKHRKGDLYGGGVSYGYNWILSDRWAMEATVGVGYAHLDYDKAVCNTCSDRSKNYWGPTKVGLNLIYILK